MISKGNLTDSVKNNPNNRGWFLGQFMPKDDFFHSEDFELKWGVHRKGEIREKPVTETPGKSICILIDGKCKMEFPDSGDEYSLEITGDFVTFDTAHCAHTFIALEDTTVLTVRYPSIPYNPKK